MTGVKLHPYLANLYKSDLAERSKSTHLERCRMLIRSCNKPLDIILKNPQESYQHMRTKYSDASTLNCMLGTVLSIMKHNKGEPSFADDSRVVKEWRDIKRTIKQQLHDKSLDGNKSLREEKGWINWNDVLTKEQELAGTQYASDNHLLLALYCLIPPGRLDYNEVEIMYKEPPEERDTNYLVITGPETMHIFLNQYKTAKKYGMYRKELPVPLCRIIHESLKKKPRKYLITQVRNVNLPMSNKSTYQKYVSACMKKLFKKPVTVNILRHSFISSIDYNSKTPRDLVGFARDMRHSLEQQVFYRRGPSTQTEPTPPPPPVTEPPPPPPPPPKKKKKKQQQQKRFQPQGYVVI